MLKKLKIATVALMLGLTAVATIGCSSKSEDAKKATDDTNALIHKFNNLRIDLYQKFGIEVKVDGVTTMFSPIDHMSPADVQLAHTMLYKMVEVGHQIQGLSKTDGVSHPSGNLQKLAYGIDDANNWIVAFHDRGWNPDGTKDVRRTQVDHLDRSTSRNTVLNLEDLQEQGLELTF